MAAFIFDASGIVKRYVQETGTSWVRALTDPAKGHEIYLSRIIRVEVTAAVIRRSRGGLSSTTGAAVILSQFRYEIAH